MNDELEQNWPYPPEEDNCKTYVDKKGKEWTVIDDLNSKKALIGRYKMQINEHDLKFKESISNLNQPPKIPPKRDEKQDLIKYLKERIKLFKELQQEAINNGFNESVGEFGLQISSYQEILDRVKEGNYE